MAAFSITLMRQSVESLFNNFKSKFLSWYLDLLQGTAKKTPKPKQTNKPKKPKKQKKRG